MKFPTEDVLSVATGLLFFSPKTKESSMDGIYEILDHLLQAQLFTHQLPRAARFCIPHILEAIPALSDRSFVNEVQNLRETINAYHFEENQEALEQAMENWLLNYAYPLLGEEIELHPLDVPYNYMDPAEKVKFINPDAEVVKVKL